MSKFDSRELIQRRDALKIPIHHGHFFVLRHIKMFTYTHLTSIIKPGMKVADIGCGGQPLRNLIKSCGGNYTSVDVVQNNKNSVDIIADISSIPLPSKSFDVIICTEVLEHCFDPQKALLELSRLLKPSGAIIITTPFNFGLHEVPYDFIRLTPFYIEYWFPKLGFKEPNVLQLNGNELEVMATVWGQIFAPTEKTSFFLKGIFVILRVLMNLIVLAVSDLLQPFLPRYFFLNMGCVAYKHSDISSTPVET
ncbi:MAG: class I SAM-dependent methyltransferase [Komarekiella atlantica HA4396-MV6]|jgi:ubiquinone/menaquinone biosynthesis C-methylase UbiE|nr:class I SAM-dependent methyltransferase [Komarekiella atlantica HA4396-MV6]